MEFLLGLILVMVVKSGLTAKAKNGKPPGNEPPRNEPPSGNPPKQGCYSTVALFWAHKTGAGFACVGVSELVWIKGNDIRFKNITLIHNGFIDPSVEPQVPGYGDWPDVDISMLELQKPILPGGGYLILRPLLTAGILEVPGVLDMLVSDKSSHQRLKDSYKGNTKNLTVMRNGTSGKFFNSTIYNFRGNAPNFFSDYHYPVLVELMD